MSGTNFIREPDVKAEIAWQNFEALRSFFRRSLLLKRTYTCLMKPFGLCEIKKESKCAACRLQKCFDLGMSVNGKMLIDLTFCCLSRPTQASIVLLQNVHLTTKKKTFSKIDHRNDWLNNRASHYSAIKVGRYTHAQRTVHINELNYLKAQDKKKQSLDGSSSNMAIGNDVTVGDMVYSGGVVDTFHACAIAVESNSDAIAIARAQAPHTTEEMVTLIEAIVSANKKHNPWYTTLADEKATYESQVQCYEEWRNKEELYGSMQPPSWDEFQKFHKLTGLEIDDRLSDTTAMVNEMERMAKSSINFSKEIPSFKKLSLNDQATLVKGSFFEFWHVASYRGSNSDLEVVTCMDGDSFSINESYWPGEAIYLRRVMECCARLQDLQITKEEDALIQAIVITAPDRAELEHADRVDTLHWNIVWALWVTVHQNHQRPSRTFCKIIDHLIGLRDLTELDNEFDKTLPIDVPELHTSQLICEMSDCPCQTLEHYQHPLDNQ